ncbi:MAG TPA: hypothetical protein DDW51_05505 [Cyanobacteria bacterium UBA11367]|nr:hypothetical protein [Cyanobacteria bacterium UBA11367]HBE56788.1 hypothetical protein [Cyanobacteria bacterium UBA11366]HCA94652.1 hypothetical protein [Cyanobacteria bacterium UBA9226]
MEDWTNNDWQTPMNIAELMADLIHPMEIDILEPAAGTGQIVRSINTKNRNVTAIEIKKSRYEKATGIANWINGDFFNHYDKYDLIIGNPPFSLRIEFIKHSLELLNPNGRILFLLPIDFYCGKKTGDAWRGLSCYIHHQYTFQHRIAYLGKDGIPQKGRQIYDAVFDIRVGNSGSVTFLEYANCK